MQARTEIDVDDYVTAFRTWIAVAHDHARHRERDAERIARQRAIVDDACRWLSSQYDGRVPIETLCGALESWAEMRIDDVALLPLVHKSCLLSRLIYAGEQLRTRKCPVHHGRWSGYLLEPCPARCNFGLNVTGWLPNDLVEEWPADLDDPALAILEDALLRNFGTDELAVYADRLQTLGDPRGELIALDLIEPRTGPQHTRRAELQAAWLGRLASAPAEAELRSQATLTRRPRIRTGFLDVTLTRPEDVRALFDHPAGRYLRWVLVEADAYDTVAIVRFLALREHRWLARMIVDHAAGDGFETALAELRLRAPRLEVAS